MGIYFSGRIACFLRKPAGEHLHTLPFACYHTNCPGRSVRCYLFSFFWTGASRTNVFVLSAEPPPAFFLYSYHDQRPPLPLCFVHQRNCLFCIRMAYIL